MNDITSILHQFKKGLLSAEEAAEKIRAGTVPAPSHTDIDYSRLERTGCPEVIYGAGKTPDQIEEIARSLLAAGQNVLATRLSGEALDYLGKNRGLHDKKRNAGEESPTDPCCRVWSHPAFLPSSRAYYKKRK